MFLPTLIFFLDAAKENVTPLPEYDVFKDTAFVKKNDAKGSSSSSESNVRVAFISFLLCGSVSLLASTDCHRCQMSLTGPERVDFKPNLGFSDFC